MDFVIDKDENGRPHITLYPSRAELLRIADDVAYAEGVDHHPPLVQDLYSAVDSLYYAERHAEYYGEG